ncbi:MFS transporter [Leuconostoc carnosum]|uniref:Major facilitator superfamily permease n=2 Tax=Leuconostoc carnosum TaxID=1252 RepID=K0D8V8_LEUCJ|nr:MULTISPECIES: MFS transporter [Leuconostoc]AFT82389.1 major facilitator superfamily permease [Leuconostoc carnosum JB16]KAA8324505.1 MFS transporter [Leuconostoc carnosum]KAA8327071.1 MFS transporter [Leuconostoc carnosum]KAA8358178.1 MFS transporter [Leuconostoc carnosum]KAA8364676.1 MFS transporter [Leuconostoc carnosum]
MQNNVTGKPKSLNEKWLLVGTLLSNTGNSMLWPVTTLYMTSVLQQSFTTAGLVLMIGALISVFGAFVGGKLFDRWRPYESMIIAAIIILVSVVSLIFWNGWPVFAGLIWLANFGMGLEQTLVNSFATTIPGEKTRIVFNNMYIVLNIGVVLGTLAVGYLFDYGFSLLMMISTVLYSGLLLIIVTKFNVPTHHFTSSTDFSAEQTLAPKQHEVKFQLTSVLIAIGGLLFITYLSYMLWETVMAPHMKDLGMPTRNYADLWMINGITIIFLQKFVSNWANKHPYHVSVILGSVIFASSFFFLIFVQSFWQIVLVFELLTIGEMLQSPQVPAWVAQITPKSVAGQAQGFVSMMIQSGRVVGPMYSGIMMDHGLMNILFISVFVVMIGITISLSVIVYRSKNIDTAGQA